MNDYDKVGCYLVKRDPPGFLRRLLVNPALSFHVWIDARRVALANQGDLTNDLVAAERSEGGFEGVCLELAVARRPLPDEDAERLVASVAAGANSPWLLGWVPLMQGGAQPSI